MTAPSGALRGSLNSLRHLGPRFKRNSRLQRYLVLADVRAVRPSSAQADAERKTDELAEFREKLLRKLNATRLPLCVSVIQNLASHQLGCTSRRMPLGAPSSRPHTPPCILVCRTSPMRSEVGTSDALPS